MRKVRAAPAARPRKRPRMTAPGGNWEGLVEEVWGFLFCRLEGMTTGGAVAVDAGGGAGASEDDGDGDWFWVKAQLPFWQEKPKGQHWPSHWGSSASSCVVCRGFLGNLDASCWETSQVIGEMNWQSWPSGQHMTVELSGVVALQVDFCGQQNGTPVGQA